MSSVCICASTYALIAFAEASVVSVPATLERSVSRTPDLRLSTSIFDKVLLSASIVLFVSVLLVAARYVSNVSTVVWRMVPSSLVTIPSPPATAVVPAVVPPSIIFNSAPVAVISVPPISSVVMDTSPATVRTPDANVIKSVSLVCPIVAPSMFTLSMTACVIALLVPKVTPSIEPAFISIVSATSASVVTVPSKNASLNSLLDEPKSISLVVVGSITPSFITSCSTEELDTSTENSI